MNLTKEEILQEKESLLAYQNKLTQEIIASKGALKAINVLLGKLEKKEIDARELRKDAEDKKKLENVENEVEKEEKEEKEEKILDK